MSGHASKKHMGPGSQGKGTGTGGMTDLPEGLLEENMVLSNRDKSRHPETRGYDGKEVQVEQFQDNVANREIDEEPEATDDSERS